MDQTEVVISDDGSKDATQLWIRWVTSVSIMSKIQEHMGLRITLKMHYVWQRVTYFADQDDIWMDNKVEVVMNALQNADFVTHDCITIDLNMNVLSKSRFEEFDIKPGFWRHLLKSRYLGCCMAFNRQLLAASLPFPANDFLIEHDIWLAAVAFAYFKVEQISEPLIYYRRHGNNASSGGFNKGYSIRVKIEKRLYRIKKLIDIYPKVKERRKMYVGHSEKIKWELPCVA